MMELRAIPKSFCIHGNENMSQNVKENLRILILVRLEFEIISDTFYKPTRCSG